MEWVEVICWIEVSGTEVSDYILGGGWKFGRYIGLQDVWEVKTGKRGKEWVFKDVFNGQGVIQEAVMT